MKRKILGTTGLVMIPVVLFIIFSIAAPGFGLHSLKLVLVQALMPTVIGYAFAILLQAGLSDWSLGTRMLTALVIAEVFQKFIGVPGFVLGCIIGAVVSSLVMALLFHWLRIPSMVLSLGYLLLLEVFNYEVLLMVDTQGASIVFPTELSEMFAYPYNIVWALAAAVLFYIFMYRTKSGQRISAIGNDEVLAKNLGINTEKTKIMAFVLSSVLIVISAFIQVGISNRVTNMLGMGSMASIFKPLIGVMIGMQLLRLLNCYPLTIFLSEVCITIIFNGLVAMGVSDNIQDVVLGAFLLIIMSVSGNMSSIREMSRKNKVRKEGVSFYEMQKS